MCSVPTELLLLISCADATGHLSFLMTFLTSLSMHKSVRFLHCVLRYTQFNLASVAQLTWLGTSRYVHVLIRAMLCPDVSFTGLLALEWNNVCLLLVSLRTDDYGLTPPHPS